MTGLSWHLILRKSLLFYRVLFYRRPVSSNLLFDFVLYRCPFFSIIILFLYRQSSLYWPSLTVFYRCCTSFYKLKAPPYTSKKIMTHFIAVACNQAHTIFRGMFVYSIIPINTQTCSGVHLKRTKRAVIAHVLPGWCLSHFFCSLIHWTSQNHLTSCLSLHRVASVPTAITKMLLSNSQI